MANTTITLTGESSALLATMREMRRQGVGFIFRIKNYRSHSSKGLIEFAVRDHRRRQFMIVRDRDLALVKLISTVEVEEGEG